MELLFPLLLVALFVPMFLGVRRQKRESEKVAAMQEGLKIGDAVTTTSGLYGTVVDLDEDTVDLEIAEDVVTTWLRKSILTVRTEETEADESAETAAEEPALGAAEPVDAAEQASETDAPSQTRLTKD
ncbi:preprotein translocase subunit YajC [Nocardia takedensis]